MEVQKTPDSQCSPEQKEQCQKDPHTRFRLYCRARVMKAPWCCHKNRSVEQNVRPKFRCTQSIFYLTNMPRIHAIGKTISLKRKTRVKLNVLMLKNALDTCTNSVPNGLKTSVKSEIPKLLEENIGCTSHIQSLSRTLFAQELRN